MELIDRLLKEIKEDKKDNFSTTSFKFKRDIWGFFQGFEDKIAVEFGTHKGQTTRILSHLFETVYTINLNDNQSSKELNSDRDNIIYIDNFNLYSPSPLIIPSNIDVFFIDAGHEYEAVTSDINRALSMNTSDDCYLVFDDYGLARWEKTVYKKVNEEINSGKFEVVKKIGHEAGHVFDEIKNHNRYLKDSEGIIVKIK